eukprot:3784454-Pyramimonas_sp.AAC.2
MISAKRVIAEYQAVIAQHQSLAQSIKLDPDWEWAKQDDGASQKALHRAKDALDTAVGQHVVVAKVLSAKNLPDLKKQIGEHEFARGLALVTGLTDAIKRVEGEVETLLGFDKVKRESRRKAEGKIQQSQPQAKRASRKRKAD